MGLDFAVQALTHAVDDFICGREVRKTTIDGVEHVDYNAYLVEYREMLEKMKAVQQQHQAATSESALITPDAEKVHVFGGTG